MSKETKNQLLDLIIIGGGISGVVSLYWAKRRALSVCLLEKSNGVGGIWKTLPNWQDIQIPAGEWTINDLPIRGILQKDILENIESWVSTYGRTPMGTGTFSKIR